MRKPRRKLVLVRDTVRVLERQELVQVAGGDSELPACPTTIPRRLRDPAID
jgi:hypothetical protein